MVEAGSKIKGINICTPSFETHLTQLYTKTSCIYTMYRNSRKTLLVASRLEKFGNANEEGATSDSAACAECGVGKFSNKPGETSCTSCDPGTMTNGTGQTFCSSCAAGTMLEAGTFSCTPCELGKFTNKPGQTSCISCDSGKVTNGTGQTFCSSCAAGESAVGVKAFFGQRGELGRTQ